MSTRSLRRRLDKIEGQMRPEHERIADELSLPMRLALVGYRDRIGSFGYRLARGTNGATAAALTLRRLARKRVRDYYLTDLGALVADHLER